MGEGDVDPGLIGLIPAIFSKPKDPYIPPVVDVEAPGSDAPEFPEGSIFAPGEIWGTDLPQSVYDEPVYSEPYDVIDPATPHPTDVEEAREGTEMAIDWGDFISGVAQDYLSTTLSPQQLVGGTAPPAGTAAAGAAGCPPRKTRTLTIDCATGQEVKRTRRRRRRLLTSSDLGDLAQLQALVGKGSNAMSVAVSKAIR